MSKNSIFPFWYGILLLWDISLSDFNRLSNIFSHHSGNRRWWIHQGECSTVLGCWNWGPFRHRTPKWYLIYSFIHLSSGFWVKQLVALLSSVHTTSHMFFPFIWDFLIFPCIVVHAVEFYFGIFFAEIPNNDYIEYFAPDYTLKVANLNMVKKTFSLYWVNHL